MSEIKNVSDIGKPMSKAEADKWVGTYEKYHKTSTRGFLYGEKILKQLLASEDAEGIWFFKGYDDKGDEKLVLYAADKEGNILSEDNSKSMAKSGSNLSPVDASDSCPPKCPKF